METVKRLKQIAFSLGIIGFIPALFLCAQTLGLGMETDETKALNTGISGNIGLTIFEELALRYCFISVCFLLYVMLLFISSKVFSRVMGLIPLIFMILQCRLLIVLKMEVFEGNWIYVRWLKITYYDERQLEFRSGDN